MPSSSGNDADIQAMTAAILAGIQAMTAAILAGIQAMTAAILAAFRCVGFQPMQPA